MTDDADRITEAAKRLGISRGRAAHYHLMARAGKRLSAVGQAVVECAGNRPGLSSRSWTR
jgi:hypothetical protein